MLVLICQSKQYGDFNNTFEKESYDGKGRPTQSVMYVPLQVKTFHKSVLLIVQYKYLKSCSGDFYSPKSDPPHKIMRYWFY